MMDIIYLGMDVNLIRIEFSLLLLFLFSDETTWFGSNIELNRRHILDSIQPKTMAEYEQAKAKQQEQYRKAGEKWPFISEYAEQFVLGTTAEQRQPTEYVRKKKFQPITPGFEPGIPRSVGGCLNHWAMRPLVK